MDRQRKNIPRFRFNPALKLMEQMLEMRRYYHYTRVMNRDIRRRQSLLDLLETRKALNSVA